MSSVNVASLRWLRKGVGSVLGREGRVWMGSWAGREGGVDGDAGQEGKGVWMGSWAGREGLLLTYSLFICAKRDVFKNDCEV